MVSGLSFVVCCHNSAKRLPQTLKYLSAQSNADGMQWEVVLIDNASTDDTVETARSLWELAGSPAPLRIIEEPKLGIGHARYRGIAEASYDVISFIDDDNWVSPDYARIGFEFMEHHSEVGACGSLNEAVSDVVLPWWFGNYQRSYAVGPQSEEAGDVTSIRGVLWSAGLILRRSAIMELLDNGFQPIVSGAIGEKTLMRSEDYEMCLALRLRGWKLWYEPRLKLKHYLPPPRLEWSYLRRLLRGVGASDLGLQPYYFALVNQADRWQRLFFSTTLELLKRPFALVRAFLYSCEGDADVLLVERAIGRLGSILVMRCKYDHLCAKVRRAGWIQH